MNVVIREAAYHDLDRIYSWIAQDRPRAAQRVIARLLHSVESTVSTCWGYFLSSATRGGCRALTNGSWAGYRTSSSIRLIAKPRRWRSWRSSTARKIANGVCAAHVLAPQRNRQRLCTLLMAEVARGHQDRGAMYCRYGIK